MSTETICGKCIDRGDIADAEDINEEDFTYAGDDKEIIKVFTEDPLDMNCPQCAYCAHTFELTSEFITVSTRWMVQVVFCNYVCLIDMSQYARDSIPSGRMPVVDTKMRKIN